MVDVLFSDCTRWLFFFPKRWSCSCSGVCLSLWLIPGLELIHGCSAQTGPHERTEYTLKHCEILIRNHHYRHSQLLHTKQTALHRSRSVTELETWLLLSTLLHCDVAQPLYRGTFSSNSFARFDFCALCESIATLEVVGSATKCVQLHWPRSIYGTLHFHSEQHSRTQHNGFNWM